MELICTILIMIGLFINIGVTIWFASALIGVLEVFAKSYRRNSITKMMELQFKNCEKLKLNDPGNDWGVQDN